MEIRFYEDPDTGLPHVYGHDVTEEEVRQVLRSRGEDTVTLSLLGSSAGEPVSD